MARIWHVYGTNGTIVFKEYISFTIVNYNMIFKNMSLLINYSFMLYF